jgi:hypothetical protein
MPCTPGSRTGSDHGPAGSVAVQSRLPSSTFVVMSQNRPSWYRNVGAYTPPEEPVPGGSRNCSGRSSTLPICVQFTRSRLWKIGTPGKYSKLEHAR